MSWRRAGLAVIMSMTAVVATLVTTAAPSAAAPSIAAASYVVADAATGEVLASQEMHTPLLAASTVKLMTALTALDLIPAGSMVNVSPNAASRPAMRIGMNTGQQWSLRDTIRSLIMVSANDAAYALAEQASGSVQAFAQAMTDKGKALGLKDSTFLDPAGLDGSDSLVGASMMSTYDLAIVARAALANPEIAAASGATTYQFTGPDGVKHKLTNHNKLLPGLGAVYSGANGLKTGFTSKAKQCMVASAQRDGRTIIAVMLGGSTLYEPISTLLDFGFATPSTGSFEKLPVATSASLRAVVPTTVPAVQGANGDGTAPATGADVSAADASTVLDDVASSGSSGVSVARLLLAVLLVAFGVLWFRPKARRSRARLRRQRRRERMAALDDHDGRTPPPRFAVRSTEVN
ncbi:MAG: D-alanyl-D-alanine carboxypeptidase family protein [Acidimicrobiia bacterium]